MSTLATIYTAIPDTSDLTYWEVKTTDDTHRIRTFVPRDKELHRRLKIEQRAEIDARLAKAKQQARNQYGATL